MTTITTETPQLETDFNSVRDGETLIARIDFSGTARLVPAPGEHVELYDAEGNRCSGVVIEEVAEEAFRVRPDWNTWMDPDDYETPRVDPVDLMQALKASVQQVLEAKAREVKRTAGAEVEEFSKVA